MLEHSKVEGFSERAADCGIASPADSRAEQLNTGNADTQWYFRTGIGHKGDAEATGRQIVKQRGLPRTVTLPNLAPER